MSVTAKVLISSQYAPTSATTKYTAPVSTHTIVDKFTATNTDASAITLTVYIVPSGGTATGSTTVVSALSIAAGVTTNLSGEMQNQILDPGDFISVLASVGSKLVIRASGREVT